MGVKKQTLTLEQLPEVLEPIHLEQYLGISRSKSYELMNSGNFRVVRIGRLFKAPKDPFVKWWLEGQKSS